MSCSGFYGSCWDKAFVLIMGLHFFVFFFDVTVFSPIAFAIVLHFFCVFSRFVFSA